MQGDSQRARRLDPGRARELARALRATPDRALVAEVVAAAEHDRCTSSPWAWKQHAARLRDSELGAVLTEDPFTEHALRKPRGYPGDAALLDRIYFGLHDDFQHGRPVSELGRIIGGELLRAPAAEAIRARRLRLSRIVDEEAERGRGLRVAAIGCGFLREGNLSHALARGDVARLTCLDQDPENVRQVSARYDGHPAVAPLHASIARLLDGQLELAEHDLIYSAGLYDYLDDSIARLLTARLLAALAPGGRLVIGNHGQCVPQRGYIEAFADWWMTYRTFAQLRALVDGLADAQLEHVTIETCTTKCIAYLDLRKRA